MKVCGACSIIGTRFFSGDNWHVPGLCPCSPHAGQSPQQLKSEWPGLPQFVQFSFGLGFSEVSAPINWSVSFWKSPSGYFFMNSEQVFLLLLHLTPLLKNKQIASFSEMPYQSELVTSSLIWFRNSIGSSFLLCFRLNIAPSSLCWWKTFSSRLNSPWKWIPED